jgi:hypothetical protein
MIDKTTQGITAEPEEVEAVLHNLCGYHLSEPDALARYQVLTREQVLYDALVAAIKRERGRALADLVATGQTLTQVAAATNLGTRQRVQRMIAAVKAADEAAAQVQAASRHFHERLAAVEATLDEVVSGITPPVTPDVPDPADALAPAEPVAAEPPMDVQLTEEFPVPDAAVDLPAPRRPMDPFADFDDPILEPTQSMPALRGLLHPTKEMPPREENTPWWRRNRDTGAA